MADEALPQDPISLAARFFTERTKWVQAGKPYRSDERMAEVFAICKECPFFNKETENGGSCGICGCKLSPTDKFLNKIAWATTECPLESPKWAPEPPQVKIGMFSQPFVPVAQEAPQTIIEPPTGGCGCGGK